MAELVAAPEASLSRVLTMPAGLDPAEYVGKYGGAALELVEAAQPLVRWWLDWKLASTCASPRAGIWAVRRPHPGDDQHSRLLPAAGLCPLGGAAPRP